MRPACPKAKKREYSRWVDIARVLEEFKLPEVTIDDEGEVAKTRWVFRGHKSACYELEPAIEREAQSKSIEWPALEVLVSSEFKSRARMHLSALSVPEDELSWLAMMQHYAVPTRLLDFTYSPFVALYFAVSPGTEKKCSVRLWAIDAEAVNRRFTSVARQALGRRSGGRVGTSMQDQRTNRDGMTIEIDEMQRVIAELLPYPRTCRAELTRQGCVCVASPPAFNQRLASQQGVFLLNCAEYLSFRTSLTTMMAPCNDWCKTFDIDSSAISEIERRLFQMNIHDQSLFPDMEGLAGLIRQKLRLHWK